MIVKYWNQYHRTKPGIEYKTKQLPDNVFGVIILVWLWIFNDRLEVN